MNRIVSKANGGSIFKPKHGKPLGLTWSWRRIYPSIPSPATKKSTPALPGVFFLLMLAKITQRHYYHPNMSNINPESPIVVEDLSGDVNFFGSMADKFAEILIRSGYDYERASGLIRVLGAAANFALQESLYPNNAEQFRRADGKLYINEIPSTSLLIRHDYGEWGRNQLQIMTHGWDALDAIRPIEEGTQGRFVVSYDDNNYCDGAVIPSGFYDAYDPSSGIMVVDGDGEVHGSFGEMVETKGVW